MKLYVNANGQFITVAKKRTSNAGTSKLKKITAKAKTIYKKGKAGIKWTSAIKKAAKLV